MTITVQERIQDDLTQNAVVLYVKGTAETPQCGFSAIVIQILKSMGIPFKAVNVLADPEIRQGIKDYSNWPTIPQLYLQGEFIGGCDIVREMHQAGELQDLLKEKGIVAA
ncbi:Grx4 family monothiol glutaredoxin [Candidatus Finniella inopinata]|uniref:Glutaredoxin n=1 Tax=Candidatus Finniella inopinata TaxID=1696036 RepID=A0A4Q7DJT6_9PROT|nr:Grx4 family monothiol glutaredoxin [Candidatus Finniella inopinata]RZI46425.1 Grx4 family monothiol glutaredoxin [Candidatus Finniella inopinata]